MDRKVYFVMLYCLCIQVVVDLNWCTWDSGTVDNVSSLQWIMMAYFISLSVSVFHSSSLATFQARQWLLPREANFSHMFLTFIPSNGPICLSKCVCCVLFPARFVPMPSLQWAPLSPGVRAEASRYLYRLNSWGPPSQSSEGMRGRGMGRKIIMETSG